MIRKVSSQRLQTLLRHLSCRTGEGTKQHFHNTTDVSIKPSICAEPRVGLYDDKVNISLKGLSSQQKVTIHGEATTGSQKIVFGSCGQYTADEHGCVDLTTQSSYGGTYTGLEPMGIVWSLKPAPGQPPQTRMAINFTNRPGLITLNTYNGHLDLKDIYKESGTKPKHLASLQLERWFRRDDVTRIEIEEGNIRGALFLPPGEGPFQGVIDMFGTAGGLIEYRSALLASRGFAAFSLALFNYKDIKNTIFNQNFDYLEEAINWFSGHPKVYKGGIGVVGVSKGAEYSMCMSAFSPLVTATVSINSLPCIGISDLMYKGQVLLKGAEFDLTEIQKNYISEEGIVLKNYPLEDVQLIPIWKGKTKHLMLVSEDDQQAHPNNFQRLYDICTEEKKKDIEIVRYPGAGHLLEPPYNALCRACVNKQFGTSFVWGGQPKEHAHAQEDSWQRILQFLRANIPKTL